MQHTLPPDIRALGNSPLFDGCSKRQLRTLQRFGTVVDLPPQRALDEGSGAGDQLFVVLTGEVLAATPDGSRRTVRPGEWCGTFHFRRSAVDAHAVSTVTAAKIFVLNSRELSSVCAAFPAIRARLFDDAGSRCSGGTSRTSVARLLSPTM